MAETEAVLLKRFVRSGDAEAFAEIIGRYAGLVYGAALRVLADVDRASDIAQETFLQLAKDAGNVTGSLPGWLHRVATHKAIDQVRRDATRRHREAEYTAAKPQETTEWKEISPYVDEGLNLLDPQLRAILISHFLEGRSTREIAQAQGLSQATISRRIEAGVEQLRAGLRRRGILVAAGTLGLLFADNVVQAAPAALLTELGKIALISGSMAASTTAASSASGLGAMATSVMTAVKTNAVAIAAVVVIGAGSAITYQQMTRPSPLPLTLPGGSVASNPADSAFDSFNGSAFAGRVSSGQQIDAQRIVSAGPVGGADGRTPQNPGVLGLPGPEAETDPRTYVPARVDGSVNVMDAGDVPAPTQPQAEASNQPLAADMGPYQAQTGPAQEDANSPVSSQVRETPYETVMRLRREAATKKPQVHTDSDLPPAASLGLVVAKAELKLVPPFKGSPAGVLALQRQDTTIAKPAHVREMPPDAPREPVYFVVRTGDREIQGITYRATRPPGPVMLFLDTDGDGLWSDETAYVGRRLWIFQVTATYEFGPVYLRQGQTQPGGDAFYAHCSDGKWLTLWPAFYRDGKVVLDGRTYRVALIDTDFDGRFNEAFAPPAAGSRDPRCDVLAIDLDGDSEFISRQADGLEIVPLSRLLNIGGQSYGIEVAEDGSTMAFRRAEPVLEQSGLGGEQAAPALRPKVSQQELTAGVEKP